MGGCVTRHLSNNDNFGESAALAEVCALLCAVLVSYSVIAYPRIKMAAY